MNWKLVNDLKKKYILLLSATPVQNDLQELFNLITLLRPGQLETAADFARNFVTRGDRLKPKNTAALRSLMREVMVRNRRETCGLALPKRKAETVRVALTGEKARFYDDSMLLSLTARAEGTEDAEKQERLRAKADAARAERERRIADVLGKYQVAAAARLDSVVLNVMPKVRAVVEVQHKERVYTQDVFYNLATNAVEPLACPRCGKRFTVAYPAEDGVFVCSPDEARGCR